MPAPRHFLYLIKPTRSTFIDDMTPEEERLLAEGRLIFAGPCLDGAFGGGVLEVESEETAFQLMMEDPSVRAGDNHRREPPGRGVGRRSRLSEAIPACREQAVSRPPGKEPL